jgi:hypothetical protein
MISMSVIDFIVKYDTDGEIKNALKRKLLEYIPKNLNVEDFIRDLAVGITNEFESMVECDEFDGVEICSGYGSNVKRDIVKAVEDILRKRLLGGMTEEEVKQETIPEPKPDRSRNKACITCGGRNTTCTGNAGYKKTGDGFGHEKIMVGYMCNDCQRYWSE